MGIDPAIMKTNVVPISIISEGILIEGQDIYEVFPKFCAITNGSSDIDMAPLKECEITEEEYNKRKQQYLNG